MGVKKDGESRLLSKRNFVVHNGMFGTFVDNFSMVKLLLGVSKPGQSHKILNSNFNSCGIKHVIIFSCHLQVYYLLSFGNSCTLTSILPCSSDDMEDT